mgnify:CR=1 FL=1
MILFKLFFSIFNFFNLSHFILAKISIEFILFWSKLKSSKLGNLAVDNGAILLIWFFDKSKSFNSGKFTCAKISIDEILFDDNEEINEVRVWTQKDRLIGFEITTNAGKTRKIGYGEFESTKIDEFRNQDKIIFGFGCQANKQNKERIRLMADIPFDHAGCNGWAIYESQYIDSDNAKNMHVVEGKITYHDGKERFTPNSALKTVCKKQKLKKDKRQYSFAY